MERMLWVNDYDLPNDEEVKKYKNPFYGEEEYLTEIECKFYFIQDAAHENLYNHLRQLAPTTELSRLWDIAREAIDLLTNEDLASLAGAIKKGNMV